MKNFLKFPLLYLGLFLPISLQAFTLYVKDEKDKTITIQCENLSPLGDVKKEIQNQLGIPPTKQRLIFNGKELENNQSLADYEITSKCTLRLIVLPPTPKSNPAPIVFPKKEPKDWNMMKKIVGFTLFLSCFIAITSALILQQKATIRKKSKKRKPKKRKKVNTKSKKSQSAH